MRLPYDARRAIIVNAAVATANFHGLQGVTFAEVSANCSVPTSVGTIRGFFRTRSELWAAVLADRRASDTVRRQGQEMGLL